MSSPTPCANYSPTHPDVQRRRPPRLQLQHRLPSRTPQHRHRHRRPQHPHPSRLLRCKFNRLRTTRALRTPRPLNSPLRQTRGLIPGPATQDPPGPGPLTRAPLTTALPTRARTLVRPPQGPVPQTRILETRETTPARVARQALGRGLDLATEDQLEETVEAREAAAPQPATAMEVGPEPELVARRVPETPRRTPKVRAEGPGQPRELGPARPCQGPPVRQP